MSKEAREGVLVVEKKNYLKKIEFIIDNLILVFLPSIVWNRKKKKIFYFKIYRKF